MRKHGGSAEARGGTKGTLEVKRRERGKERNKRREKMGIGDRQRKGEANKGGGRKGVQERAARNERAIGEGGGGTSIYMVSGMRGESMVAKASKSIYSIGGGGIEARNS